MVTHAQREHGRAESRCLAWEGQGRLSGGGDEWTVQFNPFGVGGRRGREREREREERGS